MSISAARLAVDVQANGVKETEGALGGLGRTVGGLGKPFGLGSTAALAFKASIAGAAGMAVMSGVKTASGLEQANVAFTTMLGSGAKAQAFLSDLQQFAATTPFEFPDLVRASQRLLAMGFAAKDVRPTLTAIGDAVAGLGGGKEQIDQVTTAIGQMMAKGKVQSDELLQLTEAGVPALKILASAYHVTTGKMQDMVTAGDVASSKAIPALVQGLEHGTKATAGFGGMMAKQSTTMAGYWSTLMDTFNMGMANVIKPLVPLLNGALRGAIAGLTPAFSALGAGMDFLISGGGRLIQVFKDVWSGFTKGTDDLGTVQTAAAAFGAMLYGHVVGPLTAIKGAFRVVVDVVRSFVANVKAGFAGVDGTVGPLARTFWNVGQAVQGGLQTAQEWLHRGIATVQQFAHQVGAFLSGPALAGALASLRKAFADLGPKIAAAFSTAWQAIQRIGQVIAANKPLFMALGAAIAMVVAPIPMLIIGFVTLYAKVSWFRDMINGLVTFIVGTVLPALVSFAGWLIGVWARAWQVIAAVIAAVVPVVVRTVGIVIQVIGAMASGIGAAIGWIRGILGPFLAWLGPVFHMEWQLVSNVVRAALGIIVPAVRLAFGLIKGAVQVTMGIVMAIVKVGWAAITGAFHIAMAVIVPVVKGAWTIISSIVRGAMVIIGGIVKTVLAVLTGNWHQAWEGVKQVVRGAWTMISGTVRGGVDAVLGIIRRLPGAIVHAASGMAGALVGAGASLISGLIRGIGSMGGALASYVKSFVLSHIPGPLRHVLGIGSPSRLMADAIGQWIPAGIVVGMDSQAKAVRQAASRLAQAAVPTFPGVTAPTGGAAGLSVAPGAATARQAARLTPAMLGVGAGAGRTVILNVTSHNPVAEPASVTTNKGLQRLAALGLV